MKNCFLFLLLFTSLHTFSQNVSGFYSGTLHNDTTQQTQTYELALSDYRGKVTGWAYATFVANDTFYYSIRRVKGTKKSGHLIVEDGAMIANNFPNGPDRGVRRITQIPIAHLGEADTLSHFSATWKTTPTKQFYSLPGTMAMQRRTDSSGSALFAHLAEMRLLPAGNNAPPVAKQAAPRKENKAFSIATAASAPVAYTQRSQKVLQTFEVTADSLVLQFYDNGVVDGDVISVYINGEAVISHSKLLAVATQKTVKLKTFTQDEITLVLVAETLGEMPPNTGLLVVKDGTKRYEVRFSADLQTNAAIVFRKRN